DAGGEPVPVCGAEDEKNRVRAPSGWGRSEHVIDAKVAVCLEGDARRVRAVRRRAVSGPAEKRREDGLSTGRADRVAASQQQPAPLELDVPIDLDVRAQARDLPREHAGRDSTD